MNKKDKLRQAIKSLPLLPEYAPPFSWLGRRIELRQMILNHNPAKFLTWPVITSTMITDPEYQNYHLDKWEDKTGLEIADLKSIIEFGGGYGAMVQMCYERGFKGRYFHYDFPEMVALQEFYLSELSIPIPEPFLGGWNYKLFIAINSIDESPLEDRGNFLDRFNFRHCLVRYNHTFDGINNYDYFSERDGEHWRDEVHITHWYWVR